MYEALDFILKSTIESKGSEIFIPKLKSYSITTLKETLQELLGNTGEEQIKVRQGEKYHETLISSDEIRNVFEDDKKYIIFNEIPSEGILKSHYPNFNKTTMKTKYSSDIVESISKEELKDILIKSKLLESKI
jgi:UDP-N-acetylglucosamine 4,6-dehydratase/UDP-glucose 4-epimerase